MAEIRPLRGIRYHLPETPAGAPADLAAVVAPPYDVIPPDAQARFYERHPANVIRLELGRDEPGDDDLANRYTRAAADFARWRLEGVLRQDPAPAMYVYQQQFTVAGHSLTRTSLLARVRLAPWEAGVILPHERTLARPKDDRLRLVRAVAANISPIMALCDDEDGQIAAQMQQAAAGAPLAEFRDDAGEGHALWRIEATAALAAWSELFAARQLFIADGHHRYETALAYRDEASDLQRGLAPDDGAHFVLMALISLADPGLVILPTHRLITGLSAPRVAEIPTALQAYFDIEPLERQVAQKTLLAQLAEAGEKGVAAAIVATRKHRWLARLNFNGELRMGATGQPAAWQRLDVAVAQELILDAALGITGADVATTQQIAYTRDAGQALTALRTGTAQVAVLLNPPQPRQMRDVALAGARMPQKSTFFYPKLITGLVINPLW